MLKLRPSTLQNRIINDECAIIGIVGKICVKYHYFSYEIEKKVVSLCRIICICDKSNKVLLLSSLKRNKEI